MKILAIETATAVCGTAVVENGQGIAGRSVEALHVHSEKIISLIDDVLSASRLHINEIDGIAVSIGPGSFTGLRIGLSTAKGLAYAAGKPVVPIATLESLAWNVVRNVNIEHGSLVFPMIDARRNEVYAAGYRYEDKKLVEVLPARVLSTGELYEVLEGETRARPVQPFGRFVLAGDGAEKFHRFVVSTHPQSAPRLIIVPREHRICNATTLGILGEQRLERGESVDLASLEPYYLKEFTSTMNSQPITQP